MSPHLTVDIIIEHGGGIVLIERKFPPLGWAIPGGFVDCGESAEGAAVREAKEETSLDVTLLQQLKTYSDPKRDPRKHTVAVVFIATGDGILQAGDDAAKTMILTGEKFPPLAFDHSQILDDYFHFKRTGNLPTYP